MAKTYVTSTTSSLLVGDGINGATPQPTKVGVNASSAAFEVQSTTRGLLPPRMTDAQITAIPYPAPGMQAFNTDNQAMAVYTTTGGWVDQTGPTGDQYMSGTLTTAQIQGMAAAGISLIPAQGANKAIIVKGFLLELNSDGTAFTNGGNIYLQYGNSAHAGLQISATMAATLLTSTVDQMSFVSGSVTNAIVGNYVNTAVAITSAVAFGAGGFSFVNWKIWYSVVPTV